MVGVAASLGKLECGAGGTSWPELFSFIAAAGADTFVAGSAIFGAASESDANDYDTVVGKMREQLSQVA